ncbi:urea-proton symporter DUR3-like [Elysia marginata]|uniref:Urea-proton symporter DUR3-like n=1 Tax=Elysia marginata TaxID=1093978 RepID=A0AAV4F444_9GAST|nr:urea-proton symporter DUR3-like [Elysia marginata]
MPFTTDVVFGKYGGIVLILVTTMLGMSSGSSGVMSVSSIFVYDIYQNYIQPFRYVGHDIKPKSGLAANIRIYGHITRRAGHCPLHSMGQGHQARSDSR